MYLQRLKAPRSSAVGEKVRVLWPPPMAKGEKKRNSQTTTFQCVGSCAPRPVGVTLCWRETLSREDWPRLLASLAQLHPFCSAIPCSSASVGALLGDAVQEGEEEVMRCVASALVSAVVEPRYRPLWVERRLQGFEDGSSLNEGDWATVLTRTENGSMKALVTDHERRMALCILSAISDYVQSHRAKDSSRKGTSRFVYKSDLQLFFSLCALCLSPNDEEALSLARLTYPLFPEATGCALMAYVSLPQPQQATALPSPERGWMKLWTSFAEVQTPVRSPPPDALFPVQVRAHFLAWQVHCCLAVQDEVNPMFSIPRVLLRAENNAALSIPLLLRHVPPLAKVEWVTGIPEGAQHASPLVSQVVGVLCDELIQGAVHDNERTEDTTEKRREMSTPRLSYAADADIVSSSTRLQTCLIRHFVSCFWLLNSSVTKGFSALHTGVYQRLLKELKVIWSIQNSYALAASLVPFHDRRMLGEVMLAQHSNFRATRLAELVKAMRKALSWLATGRTNPTSADLLDVPSGTRSCFPLALRRRHEMEVKEVVNEGIHQLASLISLCSNREHVLPTRRGLPSWRAKLGATSSVRSHKYELLLSEIPHEDLAAVLSLLLRYGFIDAAVEMGKCVALSSFIDVRHYPAALLSNLYLAMRSNEKEMSKCPICTRLLGLYRQRVALFDDDEVWEGSPIPHVYCGEAHGTVFSCSTISSRITLTASLRGACAAQGAVRDIVTQDIAAVL